MKKYNDVSFGTALTDLYISDNRITCRDNIERGLRDYNNDDPEEILDYGEYVEMMGFTPVNGNYVSMLGLASLLSDDAFCESEKYTEEFMFNDITEDYISVSALNTLLKSDSGLYIYTFDYSTDGNGDSYTRRYNSITEAIKQAKIDWGYLTLAEQQNRKISVIITDTDVESDNCDYDITEIYIAE